MMETPVFVGRVSMKDATEQLELCRYAVVLDVKDERLVLGPWRANSQILLGNYFPRYNVEAISPFRVTGCSHMGQLVLSSSYHLTSVLCINLLMFGSLRKYYRRSKTQVPPYDTAAVPARYLVDRNYPFNLWGVANPTEAALYTVRIFGRS